MPTFGAMGLVVRAAPYAQRSPRSQLDMALVAAAVACPIRLYFCGAAILQLLVSRDVEGSLLPVGYRGWASLEELTEVHAFAPPEWVERALSTDGNLALPVQPLNNEAMRSDWRRMGRVMVL